MKFVVSTKQTRKKWKKRRKEKGRKIMYFQRALVKVGNYASSNRSYLTHTHTHTHPSKAKRNSKWIISIFCERLIHAQNEVDSLHYTLAYALISTPNLLTINFDFNLFGWLLNQTSTFLLIPCVCVYTFHNGMANYARWKKDGTVRKLWSHHTVV